MKRTPGLWMKKELKETKCTLGGHSALVSVPCVVVVLCLCRFRCRTQDSLGFHSTIYSHQNIIRNGDCHKIAHRNLSQTLEVPSETLLFSLCFFSHTTWFPLPLSASLLAPTPAPFFLVFSYCYPLLLRNSMDSSMQIMTTFGS